MSQAIQEQEFPLHEARSLVRDLMMPNPWIYWGDFLFHITLGWACFIAVLNMTTFSWWQFALYLIAALSFYRAIIFIHELVHLKKGTFRAFRMVWNLTCGVPLLIPSFTYDGVHNDHHKRDIYGTGEDGEYLPFAGHKPSFMVGYVLLSFILPWAIVIRFFLLTPLSYLLPPLRKLIWSRASSLTIDLNYYRPANAIRNDIHWRAQEFAAFLVVAAVVTGIALDILSIKIVLLWYAITVLIFFLNSLRTLAAHAYRNQPEHRLSVSEQYLDSVNVPGNGFTTPLWAPVGLRLHATHHLFPAMPYHNLGKAHRLVSTHLSDNRLYLETTRSSLWDALKRLWHDAAESSRLLKATEIADTNRAKG